MKRAVPVKFSLDVFLVIFTLFMIAIDQATKFLVRTVFVPGETLTLAPFLHLNYLTNTGVAFSMFQGNNMLFAVAALAAIIVFEVWYFRHRSSMSPFTRIAFMMVIAGATGNLIDRLVHGHVIDFIDIGIGRYHWPAFNVADSCITIGGILIAIVMFRDNGKQRP